MKSLSRFLIALAILSTANVALAQFHEVDSAEYCRAAVKQPIKSDGTSGDIDSLWLDVSLHNETQDTVTFFMRRVADLDTATVMSVSGFPNSTTATSNRHNLYLKWWQMFKIDAAATPDSCYQGRYFARISAFSGGVPTMTLFDFTWVRGTTWYEMAYKLDSLDFGGLSTGNGLQVDIHRVGADAIQDNADGRLEVNLEEIVDVAVSTTTAQLGVNVVTLTDGAIVAADIADNAIDSATFAGDAKKMIAIRSDSGIADITTASFTAGAIDQAAIADGAIGTGEWAAEADNNGVNWADVSNPTTAVGLTSTTIGVVNSTLATGLIDAGGINAASFTADAIDAAAIGPGAIGASEIAADAITSSELGGTAATELADTTWRSGVSKYRVGGNYTTAAWKDSVAAAIFSVAGGGAGYKPTIVISLDSAQGDLSDAQVATLTTTADTVGAAASVWAHGTRILTALDEDNTTMDLNATTIGTVTTVTNSIGTSLSAAEIDDLAIDSMTFALDARKLIAIRADSGNALRPTTAGRTLDVTAGGEAGVDLDNTAGTISTAEFAAETDIVSSGAITTSGGAVSTVTTVTNSVGTTISASEIDDLAIDSATLTPNAVRSIGRAAWEIDTLIVSGTNGGRQNITGTNYGDLNSYWGTAGGGGSFGTSEADSNEVRRWVWDSTSSRYPTGARAFKRVVDTSYYPTTSGTGTGAIACSLYARASGSGLQGARIFIYSSSLSLLYQNPSEGTNTNGLSVFALDPSTTYKITAAKPGYVYDSALTYQTILTGASGKLIDTIPFTGVTIGPATTSGYKVVYGREYIGGDSLSGSLSGVIVTATLVTRQQQDAHSDWTYADTLNDNSLGRRVIAVDTTNSTGFWQIAMPINTIITMGNAAASDSTFWQFEGKKNNITRFSKWVYLTSTTSARLIDLAGQR